MSQSDPRFTRLKTDPRFRRIRRNKAKVSVDDRFKSIFEEGIKESKPKGRVDKYGRTVAKGHDRTNLRRFYRLENEDKATAAPDFARGEVLLESSDEEDPDPETEDETHVTLGLQQSTDIKELEIDLDEDNFADLDAQAEAFASIHVDQGQNAKPATEATRRLAVVNLDWDHVKAVHLYKIFSSLVSSAIGTTLEAGTKRRSIQGRVLSVRVYQSDFGQERMAREEAEGPPPELFKRYTHVIDEDEIDEKTVFQVGTEDDVDEDAFRKYQLERLRYYYAIVECDSITTASYIYSELDGAELERSANVFDLSFVPDGMTFEQDIRDEAMEDVSAPFKPLDFATDALRHSKVKLTWDQDDPERNRFTRRTLSRKEIEDDDFKAYIASSSSDSETELNEVTQRTSKKIAEKERLRELLLGSSKDDLPEGWSKFGDQGNDKDLDMEITFTPGLSALNDDANENTLEKYQRKIKEKRKKNKEALKERGKEMVDVEKPKDDFFDVGSDESSDDDPDASKSVRFGNKKQSKPDPGESRRKATEQELALLVADNPDCLQNSIHAKHFDMNAVLKAEKKRRRKGKGKESKRGEQEYELQEDFSIDVKDERFNALHEDHTFAIDPSNPHFKKTKSMAALLEERSKRQNSKHEDRTSSSVTKPATVAGDLKKDRLQSLVESVKRKSTAVDGHALGKRRKL